MYVCIECVRARARVRVYIYIYMLEGSHCIMFSNIRICFFKPVISSEIATCFTQIYIQKINHRTENRGQERNVNVSGLNESKPYLELNESDLRFGTFYT